MGARFEVSTDASVTVGNGRRRACSRGEQWRVTLDDPRISRTHCRFDCRFGRWEVVDLGSKNGTFVNGARQDKAALADGDTVRIGSTALVFRSSSAAGFGDLDLEDNPDPAGITTLVPELREQFARAIAVLQADVPVLIVGPTGSGKELLASALHERANRGGRFVPVNCGALPKDLVESELFGHRGGAFSGSREDHDGLFKNADGGTLFLDEVAELPTGAQAKLLRALQQRAVRPVGGSSAQPVDIRIVAATNRDLPAMIESESFRADLYGRLAGLVVSLPHIEERREDFGAFVAFALRRAGITTKVGGQALDQLLSQAWPMGARALAHSVVTAAALEPGAPVRDLTRPSGRQTASSVVAPPSTRFSQRDLELQSQLRELSANCKGNLAEIARRLGKDRKQIRRWVERLELSEQVRKDRESVD